MVTTMFHVACGRMTTSRQGGGLYNRCRGFVHGEGNTGSNHEGDQDSGPGRAAATLRDAGCYDGAGGGRGQAPGTASGVTGRRTSHAGTTAACYRYTASPTDRGAGQACLGNDHRGEAVGGGYCVHSSALLIAPASASAQVGRPILSEQKKCKISKGEMTRPWCLALIHLRHISVMTTNSPPVSEGLAGNHGDCQTKA
jgi:hypothetical protein